jgi:hypothetical protein
VVDVVASTVEVLLDVGPAPTEDDKGRKLEEMTATATTPTKRLRERNRFPMVCITSWLSLRAYNHTDFLKGTLHTSPRIWLCVKAKNLRYLPPWDVLDAGLSMPPRMTLVTGVFCCVASVQLPMILVATREASRHKPSRIAHRKGLGASLFHGSV